LNNIVDGKEDLAEDKIKLEELLKNLSLSSDMVLERMGLKVNLVDMDPMKGDHEIHSIYMIKKKL